MHRLLTGGRDVYQGQGRLDLSVSGGGQPRQTIDFLLSARRDVAAAKRFFCKALAQQHTVNPRTITVDKNPADPRAATEMKRAGELWRSSRLRPCKYLNTIVEQDHRRIKRLVRPGLGFGRFRTARRTLAGYEVMAMIPPPASFRLPPEFPTSETSLVSTQRLQYNVWSLPLTVDRCHLSLRFVKSLL